MYMGDRQHNRVENVMESHHQILADVLGRFFIVIFIRLSELNQLFL